MLELIIAFPRPKLLRDVIFDLTPQKNLSRDYDTPRWQQFRAKSVTWHMARLTVLQDYRENRKPSAPISSDELEIVNTALPDKTASRHVQLPLPVCNPSASINSGKLEVVNTVLPDKSVSRYVELPLPACSPIPVTDSPAPSWSGLVEQPILYACECITSDADSDDSMVTVVLKPGTAVNASTQTSAGIWLPRYAQETLDAHVRHITDQNSDMREALVSMHHSFARVQAIISADAPELADYEDPVEDE